METGIDEAEMNKLTLVIKQKKNELKSLTISKANKEKLNKEINEMEQRLYQMKERLKLNKK